MTVPITRLSRLGLTTLIAVLSVGNSPLSSVDNAIPVIFNGQVLAQTTETPTTEADKLYEQGIERLEKNEVEAAIKSWEEALNLYKQDGDKKGEANTLRKLGDAYGNLGLREDEKAIKFYEESVKIAREIGDKEIEARGLNNWGLIYRNLGQHEKSIEFFEQSLNLARKNKNQQIEMIFIGNLATSYIFLQEYPKAKDYYQQNLELSQELKDYVGEAHSLKGLGDVSLDFKDYNKAIEYYQKSLEIFKEYKQHQYDRGYCLHKIGVAYSHLNDFKKSLDYFQKSIIIYEKVDDDYKKTYGKAWSLRELGAVYGNLGEPEKAKDYYQQALELFRKLKDRLGEAWSLHGLAVTYGELQEYEIAEDYYQQSSTIFQELNNHKTPKASYEEALSLRKLGDNYYLLGKYDEALDSYKQSLAIFKELKERQDELSVLGAISKIYLSNNNISQVLITFAKMYEIEPSLISNLVKKQLNIDTDNSEIFERLDSLFKMVAKLSNEGKSIEEIVAEVNQKFSAIQLRGDATNFWQSLSAVAEEDSSSSILNPDILSSIIDLDKNFIEAYIPPEELINISQKILAYASTRKNLRLESEARKSLGLAYLQSNQLNKAEDELRKAIHTLESIREKSTEDDNKVSLFETQLDTYQILQKVLIAQNKNKEALEIAERGRAQALVEILLERNSLSPETTPNLNYFKIKQIQELAKQTQSTLVEYSVIFDDEVKYSTVSENGERKIIGKTTVGNLYIWVINPNGKITFREVDLVEPRKNINNLDKEELSFYEHIERGYTILDIIEVLFSLRRENLTLSELINRNHNKLATGSENTRSESNNSNPLIPNIDDFVVLKNQDAELPPYQVVEINTDTQTVTLTNRVFDGNTTIERPLTDIAEIVSSSVSEEKRLKQLHQLLIAPIADLLPTNPEEKVIFIPHSSLFNVPFPALQDQNNQYLIEKHTILTAPSIQVLDSTRQLQEKGINTQDILVVGNPTMPKVGEPSTPLPPLTHAEKEAKVIASRYNVQPFIGNQATEAKITQLMPNARIMHFATHGILDDNRGIGSYIALAPDEDADGQLTAGEIFDMKLNAQLVVLSACDTGRGRITGEGVIGLSRSLVAAGVESLIVSLWNVDDEVTGSFMGEFYNQWDETGNKAQALRQAMLTTMKTHPDPKYWAAFTLIGEAE